MATIARALSIRQPYAEWILTGEKEYEFRSRATNVRGRVYVYAGRKPAEDLMDWWRIGLRPGDLPTGVIVGSVEILDCEWDEHQECYAYKLGSPRRLRTPLRPVNQPQPGFWLPRFKLAAR